MLEQSVIELLQQAAQPIGADSFGKRLALAGKIPASPKFSKARIARLQGLFQRCEELIPLRNDIVHSTLQIAVVDGQANACFINTRQRGAHIRDARLITLEGLQEISNKVEKLAAELINKD